MRLRRGTLCGRASAERNELETVVTVGISMLRLAGPVDRARAPFLRESRGRCARALYGELSAMRFREAPRGSVQLKRTRYDRARLRSTSVYTLGIRLFNVEKRRREKGGREGEREVVLTKLS